MEILRKKMNINNDQEESIICGLNPVESSNGAAVPHTISKAEADNSDDDEDISESEYSSYGNNESIVSSISINGPVTDL